MDLEYYLHDFKGKFCNTQTCSTLLKHSKSEWYSMNMLNCIKLKNPVERFSENFDDKAVTYLIFFIGIHWFRKCNFWKKSLGPFWGRRGQTTSKLKKTKILNENSPKIDEIQNLAFATLKMASWPRGPRKGLSKLFQKSTFFKTGQSTEKNEL